MTNSQPTVGGMCFSSRWKKGQGWLTIIASPQFQPQTSQNEVMGMGRVLWRDSRLECRQHPRSISRRGRALTGGLVVKKQRVP